MPEGRTETTKNKDYFTYMVVSIWARKNTRPTRPAELFQNIFYLLQLIIAKFQIIQPPERDSGEFEATPADAVVGHGAVAGV